MNDEKKLPTIDDLVNMCSVNGYKAIALNIKESADKSHVFNPFLAATDNGTTTEEKEIELRKLLEINEYGSAYAKQRLTNMSFLDNEPEWKERAISILNEYV